MVKTSMPLKSIYSSRYVGSFALTYNQEPVDACAKDLIQFFVANAVQQFLQPIEQMVFVDHLDLFQFLFDCRKYVKMTERRIRRVGRVFELYYMTLSDLDFSCPSQGYRAVVQVKGRPFRVWPSSSWEYLLFE
jgi:hypothetical protein